MLTIFTVTSRELGQLSPQEAVDVFRDLLFAEATTLGIGKNLINVPGAITVADGGVDAEVKNVQVSGGQGITKLGWTRYQIKAGDFSLNRQENIKDILFKDNSTELKPRIKSCFDNDGTLVIVLFGWDDPETKDNQLVDKLKKQLETVDPKYKDAKIEVWRQSNLIGFFQPFPSLALRINKRDEARFQTHKSWASQDDMRSEFKAGKRQTDLISNARKELDRNDAAVHIRILGEPGIGKTRLAFETTKSDELSPLVIYCDSAGKFRDSDLMNEILKDDNTFSVVLVIDECDSDSRSYIWNKLKHKGPRIKLVSIHNEYEESSGNTSYFEAPLLESEEVSRIIQEYGVAKDQADRWAELCSGSPRVAHVIGWNLKNNPEDLLKPLDTVDIWNRYVVGGDDPNSQEVTERKLTLQHIALFKKLGYGKIVVSEAQAVAKLIEEADSHISWARFQQIIRKMRDRKILQGENTLYITPKALHIKLWTDWWDIYGNGFDFKVFSGKIPDSLRNWFYEMFKYAAESQAAIKVVRELLGENGPFQKDDYLKTELGGNFFLALTEADPKSALKTLQGTVGKWKKKELLEFREARRDIVWALERIIVWRDLFADAARLLLTLGEAENETYANNASGIFADLFSVGLSSTESPPEERLPILQEALSSDSRERRKLAIRACDKALESQHFTRMIGAEYQGVRREAQLWRPKTYGELWDAYQKVWELLYSKLETLPKDEQDQAIDVLLDNSRGLSRIPRLVDMIIANITELSNRPYGNKEKILERVVAILHYDGKEMPAEMKQKWEKLKDDLIGSDFSSLMRRYVGMDLLEDSFDEDGNRVDRAEIPIKKLAQQAVSNPKLLKPEFDWLVTHEAKSGYRFGYELGQQDKDFSLLPMLLNAQRKVSEKQNSSDYFLGGYLRVLFEKDKEKWESLLDNLTKDEKLASWVSDLTWRSGMSDRAASRVLELAKRKAITPGHFRVFGLGSVIRDLSEDIFKKWIDFLLDCPEDYSVSIALDLYQFFYLRKESKHKLPGTLTLRLLTHPSLFKKLSEGRRNQMDDFHWKEIGNKFIELYPEKSLPLAEVILEHLGEDGSILEEYHSQTQEVIDGIARKYPSEVWDIVAKYLGPPIDSRAFHIKEWLRGSEHSPAGVSGALAFFPPEKVWGWVDADVKKRAWYIAYFVPKILFKEGGKVCWAREILARYGDRGDVRKEMGANFYTEGWSGPASLHYQQKKEQLLAFKEGEDNENVKRWLDEMIDSLDKQIEHEKIQEERRGF